MAFQPQYIMTIRNLAGAARALINYDVIEQSVQGHNKEHDSYTERDTTHNEPGDHENLNLVLKVTNQNDQGHNTEHDSYTGTNNTDTANNDPEDYESFPVISETTTDGTKFELQSITLNLDDEIVEGETRQAEVIANWTHENVDVTDDADYESSDETVLTVDSSGFVEALQEGTATVTASYLNEEDFVDVTVLAA